MRWLAIALVLAPAVAHADDPPPLPPSATPVQPAPPPLVSMARQWAIGLAIGPTSVKASVDGAPRVEITTLALAGRYRFRPAFELALSLVVGGSGSDTNNLALAMFALDLRYRIAPEQPWNGYVFGGIGDASFADKDASSLDAKGRGMIRLGAGLERRFGAWAASADAYVFAIGENKSAPDQPATTDYQLERFGVSGIAAEFGATYYF